MQSWHRRILTSLTGLLLLLPAANAQRKENHKGVNWKGPAALGALYGVTATGLYQLWYRDYPKSDFKWFNDNREWLQMDKVGHIYGAYQQARWGHFVLREAGMEDNRALWWSTGLSYAFQSTIEIFDGRSEQWGASWGDLLANTAGSAFILAQHHYWLDQRILMKLSYRPTRFATYRPSALGQSHLERFMKDYNGQIYWLSANLFSFSKKDEPRIFPWLNVAMGYSGRGMLGGTTNVFKNLDGSITDYSHIERERQFYLSLDVDLSKIETDKKWKKVSLFLLNSLKVPAPTLIINGKSGIDSGILYF
jgi:uncharacterized protein YfiM (DUF2279 family)